MFSLSYRTDRGLSFLASCSHADLKALAEILMSDKGSRRRMEQLSKEEEFAGNRRDLTQVWYLIAAELQKFGGDSVASFFRGGEGVPYREILGDVCSQWKIRCGPSESYRAIESRLLLKVLEKSLEGMSNRQRAKLAKSVGRGGGHGKINPASATSAAVLAMFQAAVAAGGFGSYQVAVIAANAVSRFVLKRGLTVAANAGLTRTLGLFAGPVGWAVSGLLAVPMVSGPAFRVVVPAVIYVAYLREKQRHSRRR